MRAPCHDPRLCCDDTPGCAVMIPPAVLCCAADVFTHPIPVSGVLLVGGVMACLEGNRDASGSATGRTVKEDPQALATTRACFGNLGYPMEELEQGALANAGALLGNAASVRTYLGVMLQALLGYATAGGSRSWCGVEWGALPSST